MFNGRLSGTTRVSRYKKGKTNLDFTDARDGEWQWHQLDHKQVCTSLLGSGPVGQFSYNSVMGFRTYRQIGSADPLKKWMKN